MSAETIHLMAPDLQQISLAQGMTLYERGAIMDHVYFPLTGLVSLVADGDHASIVSLTIGNEGAAGLRAGLGSRNAFMRTIVQIEGRFSVIRAAQFARVVQAQPKLRDVISRNTEVLWAGAQQNAACNGMHDAPSRLCRLLLETTDKTGSNKIALTQEFLAQMLGVRRTTVTLLAQSLQEKGFITYSRGKIEILNRDGLAGCACDCYRVMKDDALATTMGV